MPEMRPDDGRRIHSPGAPARAAAGDRSSVIAQRGKGSHGTLYYGSSKTIVKDRKKEIGIGLLHDMLSNLGLDFEELRKGG
jgi:mRNA interferase HicA